MNHLDERINISEQLLYYVWRLKNFDLTALKTTTGQEVQIIDFGQRNVDSGPDFHQARIKIDNQLWVGHVEMHVKSSDWNRHRHQEDKAFQNVILHVVYEEDEIITLPNGEEMACLELKNRIAPEILRHYRYLMQAQAWIPCARNERVISSPALRAWYERVLVERLANKTNRISQVLEKTEQDWEETFYRLLGRNFGFNVNADAFEALLISLPRKILFKHKDKLLQIEALLFGQAGLLDESYEDDYARDLKSEYEYLRRKYSLIPIQSHLWKFMRMRPANFPTIRLAQFAVLFYKTAHLFSKMLAAKSVKEIHHMFESDVSGYWKSHYTFDKSSDKKSKKLGKNSIELILINTVVPFLFRYGQVHMQQHLIDRAISFLDDLPAEKNQIIKHFRSLSFPVNSALDSQALLQLKSTYCDSRRCLDCAIGNSILKS